MNIVGLALLFALCIPLVAILSDGPVGRAIGERLQRHRGDDKLPADEAGDLQRRLELLEGDVELLQHAVNELREENEFLQRLLQEGRGRGTLPPGEA